MTNSFLLTSREWIGYSRFVLVIYSLIRLTSSQWYIDQLAKLTFRSHYAHTRFSTNSYSFKLEVIANFVIRSHLHVIIIWHFCDSLIGKANWRDTDECSALEQFLSMYEHVFFKHKNDYLTCGQLDWNSQSVSGLHLFMFHYIILTFECNAQRTRLIPSILIHIRLKSSSKNKRWSALAHRRKITHGNSYFTHSHGLQ